MLFFANLLFFTSCVYLLLSILVFYLDKHSTLNKVFSLLYLSLAVWALSIALITSAPNTFWCFWFGVLASFGYTTFPSFSMHFFLLYTRKEALLKKWWIYLALYLPSLIFIYQAFRGASFGGKYIYNQFGWITVVADKSIWFFLFTIFYMISGFLNILLCYDKLKKCTSENERKQTLIILVSAAICFFVCIIFNAYLRITKLAIPDITVIGLLIWTTGILYAISKYKLMILTPSVAAENILNTIVDSVILVNSDGNIVNVNPETLRLLGYEINQLLGHPLVMLFSNDTQKEISDIGKSLRYGPIRNKDTFFISKSNMKIPIIFSASECIDNNGDIIGYVAVSRDITQLKNVEGNLKHLALHDVLTNLPNRLLMQERLNHAILKTQQNNTFVAFVLIDIDRFKEINDFFGHNVGDLLLIEVAARLSDSVRESDTVARLGGDEFVMLLSNLKAANDYEAMIRRTMEYISEPFIIDSRIINITISAGISICPSNGNDYESLLKCADLAMYQVKEQGRNNYKLYMSTMSAVLSRNITLEAQLKKSLVNNELFLHYQPIIDIKSKVIIGVEALVRWNNSEYGILMPDDFIPIAESSGFIFELGEWVLRTACYQLKNWQIMGLPDVYISVNLSALQFHPQNLVSTIQQVLFETQLESKYLMLEITESTAMHNLENTLNILTKLHELDIKIAIDDFGMGYSSLLYLKKFFIHAIKIDKCFIKDISNNSDFAGIVSAIIALAHSMNMKVIAEGIEEQEQLETLLKLKWEYLGSSVVDEGQGFLISRPVDEHKITELLQTKNFSY